MTLVHPPEKLIRILRIEPFTLTHPGGEGSTAFPGYEVAPNALCMLTGPNGAGKSTFLTHIWRNTRHIVTDGQTEVGILDQNYERLLFSYKPVWWNVTLPEVVAGLSNSQARDLAIRKLNEFNLDVDPDLYPEELSGGEKHLVLLLRMSLCHRHSILLLDEPAAGVDTLRMSLLWSVISRLILKAGKKVIISTHRDIPDWESSSRISFAGIRGVTLQMETLSPQNTK